MPPNTKNNLNPSLTLQPPPSTFEGSSSRVEEDTKSLNNTWLSTSKGSKEILPNENQDEIMASDDNPKEGSFQDLLSKAKLL